MLKSSEALVISKVLAQMIPALRHRGPDDSGDWISEADGACAGGTTVGFGHTRLAIIDLSEAARQYMIEHKTWDAQAKRIAYFLSELFGTKQKA